MLSTSNLSALPDIPTLRKLCQSLAMLDAILSPEWDSRFYSFNSCWDANSMMASMRNGSGDGYFLLFNALGAIIKGFAHESPMSPCRTKPPRIWTGVLDDVPSQFADFLTQPAFSMEDTTFCLWRTFSDSSWHKGEIEFPDEENADGSRDLLWMFDGNPQTYEQWAEDTYEQPVDLEAVAHMYQHRPLSQEVLRALNPELSLDDVGEDKEEIGYP